MRSIPVHIIALAVLAAFLAACTTQEARPPIALRHFQVDWEHAGAQELAAQDLRIQAVLLTPTQWPLQGSLKRLLHGDFMGVIDAFDLRFRSATIPSGILEELYGRGFVPAYVRVENRAGEPRAFQPAAMLTVQDRAGQELPAAEPEDLPRTFTRVDVERTVLTVAVVVLVVAAIVAQRKGELNLGTPYVSPYSSGHGYVEVGVQAPIGSEAPADTSGGPGPAPGSGADRSLLRAAVLAPGEAREGVVLFRHKNATVDWGSARLVAR
jgi:hypothetical protein